MFRQTLLASLASSNENKLRELRHALTGWELDLLAGVEFPPEEGETYYDNALAKARFGRTVTSPDRWVLGEDSGVEIEGLGWEPGVRSARWAGGDHSGRALAALATQPEASRRARYVCELVAISPEGEERRGTGILEGRIAEKASGTGGFGFDPVFIPDGEERTIAELGDAWKREHSHRARAARALLVELTHSGI
jgi:XTP/dITP diphosphohydrolase